MNHNEYLVRAECPICAAPVAGSKLVIRSDPPAETLPFGSHGKFLSGYTSRRIFFSYARCPICEGLYCPVFFTQKQLDTLYAHQPENLVDVPLASRVATLRAYFDLLKQHSNLTGNYLELGPDIGVFAELCARDGRFSEFHLYEPNVEVHQVLTSRLAGQKLHISPASYVQGSLPASSLGVAIAIHVLDHLIDPATVLRALHQDLAPHGRLFLATHDEASLLARTLGRRWPPYTLQHPQLFSPKTISHLLERCGFRVIAAQKSLNYFPITLLMRASLNIFGIERWPNFMNFPWQVGLRLGNIATVAARV
jgi:hypothetical protein